MKISLKKTCGSCRALTHGCDCDLGFKSKKKYVYGIPLSASPIEPCPKPITTVEYFYALNNFKKPT
jgi:hypothetical protein